jgi:hypothetical protein
MGWFRSSRRGAAWLALFALACQFVISFGHVHLGRLNDAAPAWVDSADAGHISSALPASPRKHPTELPADSCAICASIALAGALLIPVSAIVLAPSFFVRISPRPLVATESAGFDHRTFEARGPPAA